MILMRNQFHDSTMEHETASLCYPYKRHHALKQDVQLCETLFKEYVTNYG